MFINPVIILARGESLKIVLDARYLNSLIDESQCIWPKEPIKVILTKINGQNFSCHEQRVQSNDVRRTTTTPTRSVIENH